MYGRKEIFSKSLFYGLSGNRGREKRREREKAIHRMEKASSLLFAGTHFDRKRFGSDIARFKAKKQNPNPNPNPGSALPLLLRNIAFYVSLSTAEGAAAAAAAAASGGCQKRRSRAAGVAGEEGEEEEAEGQILRFRGDRRGFQRVRVLWIRFFCEKP